MADMNTEWALIGMIVAGVALCLLGFWVEIHQRRRIQREERRRRNVYVRHHTRPQDTGTEILDEAPEPVGPAP